MTRPIDVETMDNLLKARFSSLEDTFRSKFEQMVVEVQEMKKSMEFLGAKFEEVKKENEDMKIEMQMIKRENKTLKHDLET